LNAAGACGILPLARRVANLEVCAMRWKGREQSGNVEDRRRLGGRGLALGGGIGTVVLVAAFLLLGGDLSRGETFSADRL
jgi:hypothetical protein